MITVRCLTGDGTCLEVEKIAKPEKGEYFVFRMCTPHGATWTLDMDKLMAFVLIDQLREALVRDGLVSGTL